VTCSDSPETKMYHRKGGNRHQSRVHTLDMSTTRLFIAQINDSDNRTIVSNPSFFLSLLFLHPSSCRCGLCTRRVGTLHRGRDRGWVRVRNREGDCSRWRSSTTRWPAGVRHLLNQRAIKCLEATEEDRRMSFEFQTCYVVGDLENKFTLRRSPFYAVPGLSG